MRRLSDIVLNQDPLMLPASTTVVAACQQMRDRRLGSVLVTGQDGSLFGIFTGRDAVGRVIAAGKNVTTTTLGEVMTPDPDTMPPEATALDALRLMWDGGFRHVPVIKDGGSWVSSPGATSRTRSGSASTKSANCGSTCARRCAIVNRRCSAAAVR